VILMVIVIVLTVAQFRFVERKVQYSRMVSALADVFRTRC
jgi:hypothetical protein